MAPVSTYLVLTILAVISRPVISADCPASRINSPTHEHQLREDILCNYNTDFRPVKDHKKSVEVKVRFALKYLSFDMFEDTLTIHSWVALSWKDEFLPWTPGYYDGLDEIVLESHEIWTPRLALFNADATVMNSDSFYTTCLVHSDGTVMCVPRLVHAGICRTNIRRWPYDTQNCSLYFGSWMHTGEQVNFTFYQSEPVVLGEFEPGPGWRLMGVKHGRMPGKYACCPNSTYPMLKYSFELEREAAGPAAIVVVPSVVLVLLTGAALLLDVRDNTRLLLACFSLFGHFAFIAEIGADIPKHSMDTPIILLFLRDSMLMTLVTILLTLCLMSLRRRVTSPPSWIISVNRLVSSGPVKYVVFTEFDPAEVNVLSEETPDGAETRAKAAADWIQFSNLFNSVTFIILSLVYVIIMCTYIPYGGD